jgi:hypothetical protein
MPSITQQLKPQYWPQGNWNEPEFVRLSIVIWKSLPLTSRRSPWILRELSNQSFWSPLIEEFHNGIFPPMVSTPIFLQI